MKSPFIFAAVLIAGLACTACGGSLPETAVSSSQPQGPTMFAPNGRAVYAGSLDKIELDKAIERYRITRKRTPSPFEVGAADLNGDGQPEAIVLLTGSDWCSKAGCSLVVFQYHEFGFQPVSHTINVMRPILAAPSQGVGWRDLIVKSVGNGSIRTVRLTFGAEGGYPGNALIQPEADTATVSASERVIGDRMAAPAYTAQAYPSGENR